MHSRAALRTGHLAALAPELRILQRRIEILLLGKLRDAVFRGQLRKTAVIFPRALPRELCCQFGIGQNLLRFGSLRCCFCRGFRRHRPDGNRQRRQTVRTAVNLQIAAHLLAGCVPDQRHEEPVRKAARTADTLRRNATLLRLQIRLRCDDIRAAAVGIGQRQNQIFAGARQCHIEQAHLLADHFRAVLLINQRPRQRFAPADCFRIMQLKADAGLAVILHRV